MSKVTVHDQNSLPGTGRHLCVSEPRGHRKSPPAPGKRFITLNVMILLALDLLTSCFRLRPTLDRIFVIHNPISYAVRADKMVLNKQPCSNVENIIRPNRVKLVT
jgi:hypothetical protein